MVDWPKQGLKVINIVNYRLGQPFRELVLYIFQLDYCQEHDHVAFKAYQLTLLEKSTGLSSKI